MSRRLWLSAAAVGAIVCAALASGCNEDSTSPPSDARYTVSGSVRLTGNLFSEFGDADGSRTEDDASGVLVTLRSTSGAVDSVTTAGGLYVFEAVPPGDHVVGIRLSPSIRIESVIRVTTGNIEVPRLVLGPAGEIVNPPNPFTQAHGVGSEFTLAASQRVHFEVLSLGMQVLWTYEADLPAGFHHVHWGSANAGGDPVPPGTYVLRAVFDAAEHHNVVFMTP